MPVCRIKATALGLNMLLLKGKSTTPFTTHLLMLIPPPPPPCRTPWAGPGHQPNWRSLWKHVDNSSGVWSRWTALGRSRTSSRFSSSLLSFVSQWAGWKNISAAEKMWPDRTEREVLWPTTWRENSNVQWKTWQVAQSLTEALLIISSVITQAWFHPHLPLDSLF